MDKQILIGVYILIGFFVAMKLFDFLSKPSKTHKSEMDNLLNSEKYKVKGKFENKS